MSEDMTEGSPGAEPKPRTCPLCRKGSMEMVFHENFSCRTHGQNAVISLDILTCLACGATFTDAAKDEEMHELLERWYKVHALVLFSHYVASIQKHHQVHDLDTAHLLNVSRKKLEKLKAGRSVPSERILRLAEYASGCPVLTKEMFSRLGIVSTWAPPPDPLDLVLLRDSLAKAKGEESRLLFDAQVLQHNAAGEAKRARYFQEHGPPSYARRDQLCSAHFSKEARTSYARAMDCVRWIARAELALASEVAP